MRRKSRPVIRTAFGIIILLGIYGESFCEGSDIINDILFSNEAVCAVAFDIYVHGDGVAFIVIEVSAYALGEFIGLLVFSVNGFFAFGGFIAGAGVCVYISRQTVDGGYHGVIEGQILGFHAADGVYQYICAGNAAGNALGLIDFYHDAKNRMD